MSEYERETVAVAEVAAIDQSLPSPNGPGWQGFFSQEEGQGFKGRWRAIQSGFVDEPRDSVQRADALIAQAIKRLAVIFECERAAVEKQWTDGGDASTEDLRQALLRYRSFFERVLSV